MPLKLEIETGRGFIFDKIITFTCLFNMLKNLSILTNFILKLNKHISV